MTGKLDQIRSAINIIINFDEDIGYITRGGVEHECRCLVSYEQGGVWGYQLVDAGANINNTPYVLAEYGEDIEEGDILRWNDRCFQVGAIIRTTSKGGFTCLQGQLKEIQA
jgi:hypothetical protein